MLRTLNWIFLSNGKHPSSHSWVWLLFSFSPFRGTHELTTNLMAAHQTFDYNNPSELQVRK